jgi:hypothetical protein
MLLLALVTSPVPHQCIFGLQGHFVEHPLEFLSENLSVSIVDRGLTNVVHDEVFS